MKNLSKNTALYIGFALTAALLSGCSNGNGNNQPLNPYGQQPYNPQYPNNLNPGFPVQQGNPSSSSRGQCQSLPAQPELYGTPIDFSEILDGGAGNMRLVSVEYVGNQAASETTVSYHSRSRKKLDVQVNVTSICGAINQLELPLSINRKDGSIGQNVILKGKKSEIKQTPRGWNLATLESCFNRNGRGEFQTALLPNGDMEILISDVGPSSDDTIRAVYSLYN